MKIKFEDLFSTMEFKNDVDKANFETLFNFYFDNIPANFYKNQFELEKEYAGTSFEDWTAFLQHPAFDSWKSSQIAIISKISTDEALAGGSLSDKDSVNLLKARKEVLVTENTENKPTIIVIPESLYFKGD